MIGNEDSLLISENESSLIYDTNNRGLRVIEELKDIFRYRGLVLQLVQRNVTTRYKRSILGVAWTMINPLGTMLILTLVFSQLFKSEGYAAYLLSGLIAWNFFSQTTVACIVDLTWGGQLLQRIFIPRSLFAMAAIGTGLVNLFLSLFPLLVVILISKVVITWVILFLPVPILLIACFSLGFGLFISAFAVFFPDLTEMYQIALTAWMYLTPIIYPESFLTEGLQFWIPRLNPLYGLVKLFRIVLYDSRLPTWEEILPSIVVSLSMLVIGWFVFTKRSDEYAYRI